MNPRGLSFDGAAGVSIDLLGPRSSVSWHVIPQVVLETLRVDGVEGSDDLRTALRWGGRLGTMWVPRIKQGAGVVPLAGVGLSVLVPEVEIRRDGENFAQALMVRGAIFAGISWKTR
jgi:hypothetical protein